MAAVILDQAVVAAGIALGGAVLLLILGTQILDWYWPLLLATGGFLAGLYRALRRIPSGYQMAQQVDRRLALNDSLSSGWYFAGPEANGRGPEPLREYVAQGASRLCGTITPKAAVPLRAPRYLARTAAVALVACGLFGVRYGVRGSLDLRPPILNSMIGFFQPRQVAEARKPAAKRPPYLPPQTGVQVDPETAQPLPQSSIDETAYAPEDPLRADRKDVPAQSEEDGEGEAEEDSGGERATPGDGKQGEGAEGNGEKGQDRAKAEQKSDEPGADSSLLDKMRDAFQNMLAKLKMEAKTTESAKTASKAGKPGGGRKQGEKGDSADNRSPGQGKLRPDQQGDQTAQGGENAEIAQGQSSERNAERNPSEGEKSGVGKSDGNKDLREAEQLAAMGKISELFGKRQANLTGEVLIEVSSSRPQGLKTPYSNRGAAHGEGGGEIHRDEVPLIYQQYVQQYFEQVRKTSPAAEPARP